MKRFYLSLFLCLQAAFLMAQADSTIVRIDLGNCSIGDVLTPQVQSYVKKLILSGHMQNEDFPYVNDCSKLKILDLTDVVTDSIPQYSLIKDKPLTDIYLPKKKILFNANSVKNTEHIVTDTEDRTVHKDIMVHVTGYFPTLDGDYTADYELEDRYNLWQVLFTVEDGNEYCIEGGKGDYGHWVERGGIISANSDTLFHYYFDYRRWSYNSQRPGEELAYCRVWVDFVNPRIEVVAPYAFGFSKLVGQFFIGPRVICRHAFDGILPVHVITDGDIYHNSSYDSYDNEKCAFQIAGGVVPRLKDPMIYSPEEAPIIIFNEMSDLRACLRSSCGWAGARITLAECDDMEEYNYKTMTNQNPSPHYDKDGNLLTYIIPGILNREWFNGIMNIEDIVFRTEDADSTITANIEIDNGSRFMFVIYWRDMRPDNIFDGDGPWHYVEHSDTVYSPMTDWEDLVYEFMIVDDNGNVCFSANKRRGKESTEHLSGVLTNVPTTDQGELKSRSNGRRYGSSPWYTQRISFEGTGIRPLKTSLPNKTLFDLQGRPVTHPKEGIYIQNGKKVLLK